jgi:4,4'-diaponeurosporenoate glycosyltransferase
MIFIFMMCALGIATGFLLLGSVPLCTLRRASIDASVSIIIPARNEEHNLPRLLESLRPSNRPAHEVIVIDDGSTDGTAAVAAAGGARVLTARPLPAGWTGKTWACFQGAEIAAGDLFIFLDADTWFARGGLAKLVSTYAALSSDTVALSVLPFHFTRAPIEELSLFFNLLMAMGAGGFGLLKNGRLFGQSLIISRALYDNCGGYAAVRGQILENVALARCITATGGKCVCFGGSGMLNVRMFPDGFHQLWEGWGKAFANGAAASDGRVLALAIFWLSALCTILPMLLFAPGRLCIATAGLYVVSVLEIWWLVRQIAGYRLLTCALYPIPLFFFFALFIHSLFRRIFRRQVTWRGRRL